MRRVGLGRPGARHHIRVTDAFREQESNTDPGGRRHVCGRADVAENVGLSERIRRVKEEEKLKWGIVLHGLDSAKPPRVIRKTETVEMILNDYIAQPQAIAQRPPDFRVMTARVLKAFVDEPFESNRPVLYFRKTLTN